MNLFFRTLKYFKCSAYLPFGYLNRKQTHFAQNLSIFYFILATTLLITSSCQSDKKTVNHFDLSSEDRKWLTQFFEDIMFYENGIYTLWGSSKAMTTIAVEQYSDEEKKAFNASLTDEEKKDCIVQVGYSLDKTWVQWEKIQHRFPMNRYMLFKMDQFQDEHVFFILFVDILKTAAVIQDNYEAFKQAIGTDFHPLELTLNMRQKDSIFIEN